MPAPNGGKDRSEDSGRQAGARRYAEGEVIAGKYRLGKKLGQGGMGEVWLAHNETLDIFVAIKVIRAENANAETADRLLNEARAAARLGHPAIVRVNDFGKTESGDPYIVMERLEGEDLAKVLLERGRLSAIKAVRTLLPIAHALTAAHAKGIVHRDLKPGNIFLAKMEDGQIHPKLVDFGIAKLDKNLVPDRVTQNGTVLGSPLYMSPEQARGDDVDHRADIWALAVVLYETVAGRPPFDGKNYNAVLYSITANPPTPITDYSIGDPDLWSILDRALAKDPDRRWYSMRDLGEALARWLADRGILDDITGASLRTNWLSRGPEEDPHSSEPPVGPRSFRPPALAATVAPKGRAAAPALLSQHSERSRSSWSSLVLGAALVSSGALGAWFIGNRPRQEPSLGAPMEMTRPQAPPEAAADPQAKSAGAAPTGIASSAPVAPNPQSSARPVRTLHARRIAKSTAVPAASAVPAMGPPPEAVSRPLKDPFQ